MSARRNAVEDLPPISPAGLSVVTPVVTAFLHPDGSARIDIMPHVIVSTQGAVAHVPYIGDVRSDHPLTAHSLYVVFRYRPPSPDNFARIYWQAMRRDRFAAAFEAGDIPVGTYVAAEVIIPGTVGRARSAGHESVSEQWRTPGINYA